MNNNSMLAVIFSLLGGIIVLISDFAGWSEVTYYGSNEYYVFIGSENAPLFGQLLVVVMGLLLLSSAFFAYKSMNENDPTYLTKSYQSSMASIALVILSALTFTILAADALDYWLDVGFFGGIFGSGLSLFFTYQEKNQK